MNNFELLMTLITSGGFAASFLIAYFMQKKLLHLFIFSGATCLVLSSMDGIKYAIEQNNHLSLTVGLLVSFFNGLYFISVIFLVSHSLRRNIKVKRIKKVLKCSDKVVASYLGFRELSSEYIYLDTYRLFLLTELSKIIETRNLSKETIHKALVFPGYKNEEGKQIDAITAIHMEQDLDKIIEIFDHSLAAVKIKDLDS